MKKNYKLYKSVCLLLLHLISSFSFAQGSYTWKGVHDSNWENPKNWKPSGIPKKQDAVIITNGKNDPIITAPEAAQSIYIDPTGFLTITNTNSLNINGDFTNNGRFSAAPTSVVTFDLSSSSTIDGGSKSTFGILNINKNGGATVTNSAPAFSAAVLNVMQGNLVISASDANYNIGGDIAIYLSGTLTSINSPVVNLSGSWTNYGTFTAANSTVDFNGTTTQTINGTLSGLTGGFYNLTFNGSGSWTNTSPMDVANTLTMTSGTLTIGANAVKIQNNLTVSKDSNLKVLSDGNLVQVNDTDTNIGIITVNRNIKVKSAYSKEYNYLISPVKNFNLKYIFNNDPNLVKYVLYYNETNDYFYTSSGAYIPGRGLAIKEPTSFLSEFTIGSNLYAPAIFTGAPANGPIIFTMAFTNSTHGYNLVGNPYPSTIDLKKLYMLNSTVINSTFKYWDNTNNSLYVQNGSTYSGNSYANYNAANDTGTPAGSITPSAPGASTLKYAKVGQGFIIQALSANNFLFNNSIRETDNHNASFFSGKVVTKSMDTKDRYWLELLSPSGIINTQAVVYFPEGSNAFGQDDSAIDSTISDIFYSLADSQPVIIQGRSSFIDTDNVKLGSNIFQDGNYTISLNNTEGIFANGQNIYLKDKVTGNVTNLSKNPYTFQAVKGLSEGRFEIVYVPSSTLGIINSTKSDLVLYRNGDQFVIKSPKDLQKIEVYDASGRLIDQLKAIGKDLIIPAETWLQGIYIVKINFLDGSVVTKKVIK
jgi:hypothetical protein